MTTIEDLMIEAALLLDGDPDRAREFGGVYKFVLDGADARTFVVNFDHPKVIDGDAPAQCTIYMTADDFVDLIEGRADRRGVFVRGRLTVDGDWGMAMKLKDLDELRKADNDRA